MRLGVKTRVFFDIIKQMIKIAFFDIDGTLFDPKTKEWKKKTLDGITKAQERGLKCVLCSARPYHSMEALGVFDQGVEFDGWIGSCGAVACIDGKIVRATKIRPEIVNRFIKMCERDGYTLEVTGLYTRTLIFPQTEDSKFFYVDYDESVPPLGTYDGGHAVTINWFAPPEAGEIYQKEFPELVMFHYSRTGYDIMEVFHRKCDGMQAILDELHLKHEEAIAFGDDLQDMDMKNSADTFVCMGQGKDAVKEVADYVTTSVAEDGVYYGLEHYGLLGE